MYSMVTKTKRHTTVAQTGKRPAGVWKNNMALQAMGELQRDNWHKTDQSATHDDLRTPAGCNPIIATADSDRWVQRSAPPQNKSQAIDVTGRKKNPLSFTERARFCSIPTASPKTLSPPPGPLLCTLYLISGDHCYSWLWGFRVCQRTLYTQTYG